MATRRQLIGLTVVGAGALALRGMGQDARPAALAVDEPWDAVRGAFDFAEAAQPRIPMNAANLAPPWRAVRQRVAEAAAQLDADPSFHHRDLFHQVERTRAKRLLAECLGLDSPDDVALVRNTSEANAIVVNGLDLRPDDEVVIWDENHHSNNRSWGYRQQRTPFVLRIVRLIEAAHSAGAIVDAFMAQIGSRTRVVTFSEISNISGLRLPVARLCREIRAQRPDVFIHVDGAQSWGAAALDLEASGCDAFSASAHKWLCGPRELGILYVRRRWAERLWPTTLGYDFAFEFPEDGLPRTALRFENLGQRHDAAIAGLAVALEYHLALGPARVEQRVAGLALHLRRRADAAGLRVVGSEDPALGHGVAVLDVGPGRRAFPVFRSLYEQHGISAAFVHRNHVVGSPEHVDASAERLYLRLCPHIYNSTDDIDRAVSAVAAAVA